MFVVVLFLLIIISFPLSATNYYEEGKKFAEELKQKKELIKKNISEIEHSTQISGNPGKCSMTQQIQEYSSSLYVFVSFSLPIETWLSLSKDVEKVGGILVLRGLPENSFKSLSEKIYFLRKQGVNATVQIDPRLFSKYTVEHVPCFVTVEQDTFSKLSGNISLAFALEKMSSESSRKLRSLL